MSLTKRELAAILAGNPDIALRNAGDLGAPAAGALERGQAVQPTNELAARFEHLWREWGGPELVREYRFHVSRRWRFDYWHEATRTAIELEGGLYSAGRHTRASGYQQDIEKYNAAAMAGITVLRLGTGQVDAAHVSELADYVKGRLAA